MNHQLGYLIIYRMADIAAPYTDLQALAQSAGFDAAYIPRPPRPHNAWEKATNIKKQRLQPPADFVAKIKAEHGCEPLVLAETKIVSGDEGYGMCRHLVRSVIVKGAGEKDRQLNMASVAILKFDPGQANPPDRFIGLYHPDFDPLGATNGNVRALIGRMKDEYERQLNMADGQDMRYKLRDYLSEILRARLISDGTYFAPANVPGIGAKLEALQSFVLSLDQYKTTQNPLTCQIYAVADDGSAISTSNKREIAGSAISSFKKELAALLEELAKPDLRGPEATARRVKEAGVKFLELKKDLELFRESLGEEMEALGDLTLMVRNAMVKAQ